jgi:hypothetical protein
VLLSEDAAALDVLRGLDAHLFRARHDAVGLGARLDVLDVVLALLEPQGLASGELTGLDALVDALLLTELAAVRPRVGEGGGGEDEERERGDNDSAGCMSASLAAWVSFLGWCWPI